MYVYIYIYTYIYIHIHTYIYTYIYIFTYIYKFQFLAKSFHNSPEKSGHNLGFPLGPQPRLAHRAVVALGPALHVLQRRETSMQSVAW